MSKTFAVDCDGVLYRFNETLRAWLVQHCGVPVSRLPEPSTYDLAEQWGFRDNDALLREMVTACKAGALFSVGEPYGDALHGMRAIRAQGHRIVVVTARNIAGLEGLAEPITRQWLDQAGFGYDDVVLTHNKHEVEFDLLLDDCPANIEACLRRGRTAVLLKRPWNDDVTHLPKVTWGEVVAMLSTRSALAAA
jgi:hypothetical protein